MIAKETAAVLAWNDGRFKTDREREAMRAGAEQVAWRALEAAGCLDADQKRDAARNTRLANEADRKHRRVCRSLGITY